MMKEAIIKYDNPKTLNVLKSFAKYFNFSILPVKQDKKNDKNKELNQINGVSYIEGNPAIDVTELAEIFTGKKIDAKKLREEGWQRRK